MDRIINVKVGGNHLSKDNKNAGVRGEGNVTLLRITFDEGWDGYAKTVTFFDAHGNNPVKRVETVDLIEDIENDARTYLTPIPPEAMTVAGELTFVIDGYLDGKRQRSFADTLVVKDAPIADNAGEPTDATPTEPEQWQTQIDTMMGTIQEAFVAKGEAVQARDEAVTAKNVSEANAKEAKFMADRAEGLSVAAQGSVLEAEEYAKKAEENAKKAEDTLGKTNYIGDNGNWYAWDSAKGEFYDTGVKAQSGSTVYLGDNPPEEADVWIDPNGDGDIIDQTYKPSSTNAQSGKAVAEAIKPVQELATQAMEEAGNALAYATIELEGKINSVDVTANDAQEKASKACSDIEGIQARINEEAHFRGYVATYEKVLTMEGTPNDFVYSAESGTKWVYDSENGWQNTGVPVPDQLTPASSAIPLINGAASAGTANEYARGDHRHPTDTTRLSVEEFNEFKSELELGLDRIIAIQNNLMGVSE